VIFPEWGTTLTAASLQAPLGSFTHSAKASQSAMCTAGDDLSTQIADIVVRPYEFFSH
jgi:hypothetical protein